MAVMLLSLLLVTVIQLTSSQSTYDVTKQDNDVDNCESSEEILGHVMAMEQVLGQLVTAMSQLQKKVDALSGKVDALGGNEERPTCTNATAKGTLRKAWRSNL